ncbi:MAG: glycosyltransferase [Planctomycetaceae bacterium]|jgi:glycosyltransferase involved in cell wall biosynthesis|nr:glycosyltransferase [Planctomycetaceae bacterium]
MIQVSVIIPVKNDLSGIQRLVGSLRQQTVPHELIVVDNGSTDGTLEFLESQGIRLLNGPGLTVGSLRNRGVEISTGIYIAFADSDHEVGPDWLEKGREVLDSNPDIVACGAHYLPPANGTWVQKSWAIHRLRNTDSKEVEWLASGNLFVRREKFLEIQGFNESLIAAEDVDLCHRLRVKGGKVFHDPGIASIHHGEASTVKHFIRKEWWRGSSGIRAWISQRFPIREVPSLIWPLWHLVFCLIFMIAPAICFLNLSFFTALGVVLLLLLLWVAPSILLAIQVGSGTGIIRIAQLAFLYFLYGTTRGWALFRN